MPQLSIGDLTGTVQVDLAEGSHLARIHLLSLKSPANDLLSAFAAPVARSKFKDAALGAAFQDTAIPLDFGTLGIKAGVNAKLALAVSSGDPLFGADDYDPVKTNTGDYWLSFELDTLLSASATVPLPDGLGVCFKGSTTPALAVYLNVSKGSASNVTLRQAAEQVLNKFAIPDTAESILDVPEGVLLTWDISGAITIGGSWSLPISVNQLSLIDAQLPFNKEVCVSPAVSLKVAGDVSVSSEFNVRVRRTGTSTIRFGLYRKHGAQLDVSFTAAAGVKADAGKTDLVNAFFTAVDPKIDTQGLAPADLAKIAPVLKSSIDHSLSMSLNAACSASLSDEAAIVYEIDTSAPRSATAEAIASALKGRWAPLSELNNAKTLRNVVIDTVEKKTTLAINILGLYNYKSVSDFVRELRVLQDLEHGSVVITDNLTASQITTASEPLAADKDRLAAALYQGFVVTATYQALLAGIGPDGSGVNTKLSAQQNFLLYSDELDYRGALKQLNTGEQLGVVPITFKSGLPGGGDPVHHARFAARVSYDNNDVLSFFFSDIDNLTARGESDVKRTGRQVLAALLDPQNGVDHDRIVTLQSDEKWAQLEANPTETSPFHADWYDISTWAAAIVSVPSPLAAAIRSARSCSGDPSVNPDFMKKRATLAHALENVLHNTKAAYEKGFPICVMTALCGDRTGRARATFEAGWNSRTIFTNVPIQAGSSQIQIAAN